MQRFPAVAEKSPAWLIMMIGVNDAKHMRLASTVPIVSALETKRNVEALQEMATAIGARAIWLVPPYHDEVALRDSPFISGAPVSWNMEDMVAMREVLLETCPDPLDLAPIFTYGDGLRMDDGVHPTLKGQQAILRDLCSFLADRA
jgi:lysophospholipase L1-like esterase